VPLAPLDGYRDRWQDRPVGVLKIDVEGYEEVFRGSDALLRRDRPRLIMFESLEGTLDAEIRQFLEERSYTSSSSWTRRAAPIQSGRRTRTSLPRRRSWRTES
jgi:hypothetical protein